MVPKHAKYVGQRTRFTCITGALVALQNGFHPQEKTFAPFLPKIRIFEVDNGLRDDGLEYEQCVDNHPTWYFTARHTIGDAASIVFG